MPIDLYSSIKKTSQWAFGSPALNSILGSCVFVAVVIALVMIMLVMIMYPAKAGTSFSIVAKMFVYMLFGSMLIIFLHDGILRHTFEEEIHDQAENDIVTGGTITDLVYGVGRQPIDPSGNSNQSSQYNQSSQSNTQQNISSTNQPGQYNLQNNQANLQNNQSGIQSNQSGQYNSNQENTQYVIRHPGDQTEVVSIVEGGPVTGGNVLGGVKVPRRIGNPFTLN